MIFEKLFKTAAYSALSKAEREKYEESLKYYNDLKNSLDTAFNDGKEEAQLELLPLLEEERKQKEDAQKKEREERKQKEDALDTIRNMVKKLHSKGISISEIAAITGKTEDKIKIVLK